MEIDLNRAQLRRLEPRIIQSGTHARPEIALYSLAEGKVAVKDCACMDRILRFLMGRRNQRREVAVYKLLEGVRGVPFLAGVIDSEAFAVEFIDGETLARSLGREKLEKAVGYLETVIDAIHQRGVVHLDLKQKRNVLVKESGEVAVVDFQSALIFGRGWLGRVLLALLKGRDKAGLVKFKAKYVPHLLTAKEKRKYQRDVMLSRIWPFKHITRLIRRGFKGETTE